MKILFIEVDDERQTKIKSSLSSFNYSIEFLESSSAEDGVFTFFEEEPQIVVATCFNNSTYCFRLANVRNKLNWKSYFLLLTNSSSLAIQAIKSNIDALLVEPFSEKELESKIKNLIAIALKNIPKTNLQSATNQISIITNKGDHLIHIDDIVYCRADGSYCMLTLADGKTIIASHNLGKIEDHLDQNKFFRVNRSNIINLSKIASIDKRKRVCGIKLQNDNLSFKISIKQLKKLAKLKIV